jgi:tRNA nucleotidyltransferase (CCA-adding enzyme)
MLFTVRRADILAQSDYQRQEKLRRLETWEELYQEIVQRKECVSLKTLAVTGRDLIALGMKPGPQLGEVLAELLELVLEQPECNNQEYLTRWIRENK